MGVDYSATFGYGFLLDRSQLNQLAAETGYFPSDYDSQEQAIEEGADLVDDDWEFVEWFASRNEIEFGLAGSAYSGEYKYLLGEIISARDFGFDEVNFDSFDKDKVDRIAEIYGQIAKWYAGVYVS